MSDIRIERDTGLRPSFFNHQRVLRTGASGGSTVYMRPHDVQLVSPSERAWKKASVFVVTLSEDLLERWPKQPATFRVVAVTEGAVKNYAELRFGKIAKRNMGLGQETLTVAMRRMSTRNTKSGALGKRAKHIAQEWVNVVETDGGDTSYTLEVVDNLCYAIDALKGGEATIDLALKSAANRIAGRLRHMANYAFDEDLKTPFPEVVRKKRKAVA